MPSKLFNTTPTSQKIPTTTLKNAAGGPAYALDAFHALCQIACTGTFQSTFYDGSGGQAQLDAVNKLVDQINPQQLASIAVYARQSGFMKDMPVGLLIKLSKVNPNLFEKNFQRVINTPKLLRTFFQLLRSGAFGRKAISSVIQRAISDLLDNVDDSWLINANIGEKPSLRDILRACHYKPKTREREAAFSELTGLTRVKLEGKKKVEDTEAQQETMKHLPMLFRYMSAYNKESSPAVQAALIKSERLKGVRWDLLTSNIKGPEVWRTLALSMKPMALRMNLNTLFKHGAFNFDDVLQYVCERLADPAEVKAARAFPMDYLNAYLHVDAGLPQSVKNAIQRAAEHACGNVPRITGPLVIGVDVSGSMDSPVMGTHGKPGSMRCVDVAAILAAALWRQNPDSVLVPFNDHIMRHSLDPNDSLLTLSRNIAGMLSGGTNCSMPIQAALATGKPYAGILVFSDNMSWYGETQPQYSLSASSWVQFNHLQKKLGKYKPKYVGVNLQPSGQAQNPEGGQVMNLGGFSGGVFDVISAFFEDDSQRFVNAVTSVDVNSYRKRERVMDGD